MHTTVTIDDALYQRALELSDPQMDQVDVLREAVMTYVRLQTGKRLSALGGSAPDMQGVPRARQTMSTSTILL